MKHFLKKFNEGEHLVKVVEHDPYQFVPKFVWITLPLLFIIFVSYIFLAFKPGQIESYIILGLCIVLLTRYFIFYKIVEGNYMLISNHKLIYVERLGLFKEKVIEMSYNQLRTVTCHTKGFLWAYFDVGEIIFDRGGFNNNVVVEYVYHPQVIQDIIMKLQREHTYARHIKEVVDDRGGASSSLRYGNGDLTTQDLILFLGKILDTQEQKRIIKEVDYDSPSPVSYHSIPSPIKENSAH